MAEMEEKKSCCLCLLEKTKMKTRCCRRGSHMLTCPSFLSPWGLWTIGENCLKVEEVLQLSVGDMGLKHWWDPKGPQQSPAGRGVQWQGPWRHSGPMRSHLLSLPGVGLSWSVWSPGWEDICTHEANPREASCKAEPHKHPESSL